MYSSYPAGGGATEGAGSSSLGGRPPGTPFRGVGASEQRIPRDSPAPVSSASSPAQLWTPAKRRQDRFRESPSGSPSPSWGRMSNGVAGDRTPNSSLENLTPRRSVTTPRKETPVRVTPSLHSGSERSAAAMAAEPPSPNRTSGAPGTPLRWEHPALSDVASKLARGGFNDFDAEKLTWNCWGLAILVAFYFAGWYRTLSLAISSPLWTQLLHYSYIGVVAVMALNVVHLTIKYFKPVPAFSDYALTPTQRALIGLDPSTPVRPEKYKGIERPVLTKGTPTRGTGSASRSRPGYSTPTRRETAEESYSRSPYRSPTVEETWQSSPAPVSPLAKFMLSTSPATMHKEPIRDKHALDAMMKGSKRIKPDDDLADQDDAFKYFGYDLGWASPFGTRSPDVPQFGRASQPSTAIKVQERMEDGLVIKDPEKTHQEWRITNYIDEWSDNMRAWVANKVGKPLAERIAKSDAFFKENGIGHLCCAASTIDHTPIPPQLAAVAQTPAPAPANSLGASAFGRPLATPSLAFKSTLAPAPPQKPQSLYELGQNFKNLPWAQERIKLENYLTIPDYACREYIVQRIKTLATGNNLVNFRWNGGSDWAGVPWTSDQFPTDAQLVMHLFCRFLDERMPGGDKAATFGSFPFSAKHVVPAGRKPDVLRSVQLRHYTKWPPHYHTVIEGKIYDLYSGRNNVFHALCLFAYYIKIEAGGYVGTLHVGGANIELTKVVQGGPPVGSGPRFGRRSTREEEDDREADSPLSARQSYR
ncbi:hypothetical protein HDU88_004598 [Geranomyces variabilis]|nr:hypothetical protein HDU88_004598 [Geranomyces variabilis]